MGLNHSVRIRLRGGNNQILYPGQHVAGTVEYKGPTGERLQSVTIDFRGMTKIIPRKGAQHIDTEFIELFHMGEKLLQDAILIVSGKKYVWDFSFELPTLTGPDRSQGIYQDDGDAHFDTHVHTLPPSINSDTTPETKVEYKLYAVAHEMSYVGIGRVPTVSNTRSVVDVLDGLQVRPDVEDIPPSEPHVLEKPFLTADGGARRRFSIRSVGPSRSNSIALDQPFTLVAKVPSVVVFGEDFDVDLSVRLPKTSSTPGAPTEAASATYTHKLTTLAIESTTHRRTTKRQYEPSLDIVSTIRFDPRKVSKTLTVEPDTCPLRHRFSTDKIQNLPPSFKSYSLARAYRFLLNVTVSCGKQEHEAVFLAPVQLVHRASHEQVLARRALSAPPPPPPVPELWGQRRGVEEDLPPAYEPRRT